MRVLFLHNNQPDYLGESLFHGLRALLGPDCIDVPRYDSMYSPLTEHLRSKLRGYGFTLYGLLKDILELAEIRYFWQKDIKYYDLIVIANIWEQWELLWDLSHSIDPEKLVVLDSADIPVFFPFASILWRLKKRPWSFFIPIWKFKYFKRELIGEGYSYMLDRLLPHILRKRIPLPRNARPISFSIPAEKICKVDIGDKTKDFTTHIVDPEVAVNINDSFFSAEGSGKYVFSSESEYYSDLRKSRFGITKKRAGWDTLRHYELAANGCIICFRDLDLKPKTCAPHGLNEDNCIIYHSFNELNDRISSMRDAEYIRLQEKTYEWIRCNTTIERAKEFLKACEVFKEPWK